MKACDVVKVEISKIGRLKNFVADEAMYGRRSREHQDPGMEKSVRTEILRSRIVRGFTDFGPGFQVGP
jgi:hypothetical protein